MKHLAAFCLFISSLSAFAATGSPHHVRVALTDGTYPLIAMKSSMGRMEESCSTNSEGDERCHNYYVKEYNTIANVELIVNSSALPVAGKTVTITFEGESATARTNSKDDLYFEIDVEKKLELAERKKKVFSIKLTLTPRLQSTSFAGLTMSKLSLKDNVISFTTLPEGDVPLKTTMAASEKKILFYSLVWWEKLISPVVETTAVAGRLVHQIHLNEIPEIRSGEKYRFDLYRSTDKANSLNKTNFASIKARL